jgi:hypothetical protein
MLACCLAVLSKEHAALGGWGLGGWIPVAILWLFTEEREERLLAHLPTQMRRGANLPRHAAMQERALTVAVAEERFAHLLECIQLSQRYCEKRTGEMDEDLRGMRSEMRHLHSELALIHSRQEKLQTLVEERLSRQDAQLHQLLTAAALDPSGDGHAAVPARPPSTPSAQCSAEHTSPLHGFSAAGGSSATMAPSFDPLGPAPSAASTGLASRLAEDAALADTHGDAHRAKALYLEAFATSPEDGKGGARPAWLFSAAVMAARLGELDSAGHMLSRLLAIPGVDPGLTARAQQLSADIARAAPGAEPSLMAHAQQARVDMARAQQVSADMARAAMPFGSADAELARAPPQTLSATMPDVYMPRLSPTRSHELESRAVHAAAAHAACAAQAACAPSDTRLPGRSHAPPPPLPPPLPPPQGQAQVPQVPQLPGASPRSRLMHGAPSTSHPPASPRARVEAIPEHALPPDMPGAANERPPFATPSWPRAAGHAASQQADGAPGGMPGGQGVVSAHPAQQMVDPGSRVSEVPRRAHGPHPAYVEHTPPVWAARPDGCGELSVGSTIRGFTMPAPSPFARPAPSPSVDLYDRPGAGIRQ